MVKIVGSKIYKLSKKRKFCGNRGEIYKFCRNTHNFQYASLA